MISCELFCEADSRHLQQIYTGLARLHTGGVIRLRQRVSRHPATWPGVRVLLDGAIAIYYDMHDGAVLNMEALREVQFYFKRSYTSEHKRLCGKIFPFGLNYCVLNGRSDAFKLRRTASFGPVFRRLCRVIKGAIIGNFPTAKHLECPPNIGQPVKILLMTRLWGPAELIHPVEPPADEVNFMRAQCIRLLRKEFGDRFFGGVCPSQFASSHFGDVVLPFQRLFEQRAYLRLLRDFPICVTTMGLYRSNGFRLGEYVAHSKAIVAERPAFEVPGGFSDGVHYLAFSTPEECVQATSRLVQDARLRHQMMIDNFRYYQAYLRPDSLLLNTLAIALGKQ